MPRWIFRPDVEKLPERQIIVPADGKRNQERIVGAFGSGRTGIARKFVDHGQAAGVEARREQHFMGAGEDGIQIRVRAGQDFYGEGKIAITVNEAFDRLLQSVGLIGDVVNRLFSQFLRIHDASDNDGKTFLVFRIEAVADR